MIEYIIFDFDGVIIFSENARSSVVKKILTNHSIPIHTIDFNKLEGRTTKNFLSSLRPTISEDTIEQILTDYNNDYKKNIASYVVEIPSTVEFIKTYKGPIKFGIASMSTLKIIDQILEVLDIKDRFEFILSQEDAKFAKPNPDIYLKSIKKSGVKPENVIILEDSAVGAQAALAANADCYIVLNSYNKKENFNKINIKGFIQSKDDIFNIIH